MLHYYTYSTTKRHAKIKIISYSSQERTHLIDSLNTFPALFFLKLSAIFLSFIKYSETKVWEKVMKNGFHIGRKQNKINILDGQFRTVLIWCLVDFVNRSCFGLALHNSTKPISKDKINVELLLSIIKCLFEVLLFGFYIAKPFFEITKKKRFWWKGAFVMVVMVMFYFPQLCVFKACNILHTSFFWVLDPW